MSYFAPYIDSTGLHMPTYEERLAELVDSYRTIFGIESELSASVPDYQLLSVFAKAPAAIPQATKQTDNLDGTVTVTLTGSLPAGRKEMLPVPMGVTANQ